MVRLIISSAFFSGLIWVWSLCTYSSEGKSRVGGQQKGGVVFVVVVKSDFEMEKNNRVLLDG